MKRIIGMRNIKTALAIFICVVIASFMKLEYPFYAAIATVISMENSVTNSFTAGKNRMMGTFVGAATGLLFATFDPGNIYYCALGIIMLIYLCNLLKWNKAISIASIVFLAIMLNLDEDTPFQYSLNRITDTLIGVSVAVLVNYFVFPPKHEVNLRKARRSLAKSITHAMELLVLKEEANLKSVRSQIKALEKFLELSREEFRLVKDGGDTIEEIMDELDSYKQIYEHLKMIQKLGVSYSLHTENMARLGNQFLQDDSRGQETDPQYIVYNYHVNWMLDEFESLGLPLPFGIKTKGELTSS
ncbi:MAG: aromatic acid exporter family protein [Gorillibacterium sp.]|nr:aromatic acid exporter family protein [Gorillibacterium sp.]